MNPANLRQVLDCASPLALLHQPLATERSESARGLAQSKTLARPGPGIRNTRTPPHSSAFVHSKSRLLIPRALHWLEPPCPPRRNKPTQDTHNPGTSADQQNVSRNDHGGKLAETVNRRWKKLEASHAVHEVQKLITIRQCQHPQAEAGRHAKRSHQRALAEEQQAHLQICRPERLE